jgi:hypothetical protein
MTDILAAFLDFQAHGKRCQNVILRLATAYSKVPELFMPENIKSVSDARFRNLVFYQLRIPASKRWAFVINVTLSKDPIKGLKFCVNSKSYPLFRLFHDQGVVCVYDATS